MEIDLLRAELERLFELEELLALSRDLLGFEPDAVGGVAGKGSFARALTDHCVEHEALEALCDAVALSKVGANPLVAELGHRGLPAHDEIALGEHVGPYLVVRKLGEGPAAISYAARTEDGDVRLKVLRTDATHDQRALRKFLTLTRLAARVRDQSLPWRLRVGHVGGRHFVAQEAVDGQPLSARIGRTGPMHINEAKDLVRGLLGAVGALHAAWLVHGNLKLENAIVHHTADGAPRVVLHDPFADRLRVRSKANGHVEPWSLSSPKTVSPEQLRGHAPTAASDLYSFGALLFELLTGKPLFGAETVADAIVAHLSEKPRAPSTVAPRGWITTELDAIVLGLLEKDPKARPATVERVLERLESLGKPQQAAVAQPTITEETLAERIDAIIANPESDEAALALESAASEGADPGQIAEALMFGAEQIDLTSGAPSSQSAAKGLLFRAGRLFQDAAGDLDGAEKAYAAIVAIDPEDGTAVARLDELRQKLGKYDELIESLLARAEQASAGPERAEVLARIGRIYAGELQDPAQALVAITQAFCEDPQSSEYGAEVEKLAGTSPEAWGDVLAACNEASTGEQPSDVKNALFRKMGPWYRDKYNRPDLALQCFQAILVTEPGNEDAQDGLAALYRKAQQWPELGMLLLARADGSSDAGRARDLRCDAATILETHLSDAAGARALYAQVLEGDAGHPRANEALARLLAEAKDYAALVKLLDTQAAALRGDEKRRVLCRIAELYEDRLDDDVEAGRRYSAVLADDPGSAEALRGLDRLYSKAGRFPELLENLGQQIQVATTPRQKIALWERVAAVHDEEFLAHDKAAFALEQVLELDPAHDSALTNLARHYRALSRFEDLAALYERHLALLADPSRKLEIALALGAVLADHIGSVERAIAAFERSLALSPGHAGSLERLAKLREAAGDEDAALAALDTLAEQADSPESRAALLDRSAKLLESRGDRDRAIERYKRALDATPKDAGISASLRAAYVARGDGNAAADLLEREIAAALGELQKAKLTAELAVLCLSKLGDAERADKAARRALDYDPTDVDALRVVADVAFDAQRFVEASAFYEKLAARTDVLDHDDAVAVLERYVDALSRSASTEKALAVIDTLHRLAPDSPRALLRVARVTFDHGSPARALELYSDLLARFGEALGAADLSLATYHAGESARRAGDVERAVEWLESAADLDPANPDPLIALAASHEAKERWDRVVDAKSRHLDLAQGEVRFRLLVEIGELAAGKLNDRALATKSLVAALDERPDDRKLLARLMQLYSEDKDWQKLVDVVIKLADFVDDPTQKAKYLHTAAMVTGQEMRDFDQALGFYDRVIALDRTNYKAIDDAIEILESKGDYTGAVERLKEQAKLASDAKDTPRMLGIFTKLVPIYLEKLGRIGHAVDALEAAQTLEPDNKERNRELASLYAAYPERFMQKAVAAQVSMLRQNPYRVESYKLLRKLYTDAQRADAAWALCQALYVLKLAEPDEERFFRRMRAEDPAYARAAMTPDDWLELVFHADADPMLTSLFAIVEPAVIAARGATFQDLGIDPRAAVDPATHPYPITQTIHYAAGVSSIELPPIFENPGDDSGLGILPTQPPSIVLGGAALAVNASPQALAFLAGRHLAYFRPGFYARQLIQSGTGLRAWLFAAIKLNVPQFPTAPDLEGPVREAMAALDRHLSPQLRDHLARIVSKLLQSGAALDLKRWVQGVDLTADRLGFILSHDLETSVEIIRASDETSSALAPQARLKELVLYAIGEPYFTLRERLGIGVDGEG